MVTQVSHPTEEQKSGKAERGKSSGRHRLTIATRVTWLAEGSSPSLSTSSPLPSPEKGMPIHPPHE